MRATLHTDGAARRKLSEPTGAAGIGAVLRSESGETIGQIAKGIGPATNNVAEYTALIEGLQMALDAGVTDIDAYIDSPVVAGHLLRGTELRRTTCARSLSAYASCSTSSRPRRSLACPAR